MKSTLLGLFIITMASMLQAQKHPVWLDADTGNEMDDLVVFEKWNAYDPEGLNTVARAKSVPGEPTGRAACPEKSE